MKTVYLFFAARRYWKNEAELQAAYRELSALAGNAEHFLITESDTDVTVPADCAVLIPMSGAIQKRILTAAAQYENAVLYGAYIRGNASAAVCEQMLRCNTAPALMDVFSMSEEEVSANAPVRIIATNGMDVLDENMSRMELIRCPEDQRWITLP